jgi:sugar transferase (PEP-CTERM/EpsH1 system associated)
MGEPILYLTHRVPFPPDKGDRIRNWNILRFLAERFPVWLGCLSDEPLPAEHEQVLRKTTQQMGIVPIGRERWVRGLGHMLRGRSISEGMFWSPRLANLLAEWGKSVRFRTAIISASSLVPYLKHPILSHTTKIVDLVDVDSQKWFDYAAKARFPRSVVYRLEGQRVRKLEQGLPTWVDGVLLVSDAEAELYRSFASSGHVRVVTNGVDLEYFRPLEVDLEPVCTFVGALDYPPNVDAAEWFATEVWPAVRTTRPDLRFRLVGRNPSSRVLALKSIAGIEVVASVPDVRPWLARSTVVVVPLRIARGLQNKVLEALAMAKACVVSPKALAGVKARPGSELLAVETPEEWVAAILRLFHDSSLRRTLGEAGRQYVQTHHSWAACLNPLAEWLATFPSSR